MWSAIDQPVRRLEHRSNTVAKGGNVVERCFNRLKGFRSIATRYDKTATSHEAAVSLASFLLWARSL
jgi:transposase